MEKKISVNNKKTNCEISIRLNDQCHNGHQDFAITGMFWTPNRSRTDGNMEYGGCCHEEIVELFPDLKMFVDLHLCDYTGVPTYAVGNGFYHIKTGFDNIGDKSQKEEYCEYYRVTPEQYDKLFTSYDELEFHVNLINLGVLSQWEKQADTAILALEELTGEKFINTSTRTQIKPLTKEEEQLYTERKLSGYYSSSEKIRRKNEEHAKRRKDTFSKVTEEFNASINKIKSEKKLVLWLMQRFDKLPRKKTNLDYSFSNFIYYTHSNTLAFNWKSYGRQMTEDEFKLLNDSITERDEKRLPSGLKLVLKDE